MSKIYKTFQKAILGGFILGFMAIVPAQAQFGDIGAFLRAGAADAELLTKEYIRPLPTGFGSGLNAGFTEGATPKKTLGFSLQIRPSLALVPSSDQSFDIANLALTNIRPANPNNTITPTISGESTVGPELIIEDNNGNELSRFDMPKGIGIPAVPAPIIQAGIGLIKSTDVTLRYMPETTIDSFGSFSVLGGAIKHGINQYVPGGKVLPVDISVLVGFNKVNLDADLDVKPRTGSVPNGQPGDFENQAIKTETSTFVVNAYVGKTLPFISVYGGLGYQKASLDVNMIGDYPVELPFNRYDVITDPFAFTLDSESSAHLIGGFRLKLGILAFYGEATLANYFTANAGIGISFR
ncbi:MAG: hypothetical protein JXR20_07640 [Balneola sp.]